MSSLARKLLLLSGSGFAFLLRSSFTNGKDADIGTLSYTEADGSFTATGGKLTYPAQGSPVAGDLSVRSQLIISAVAQAQILTGTINQSTRGASNLGWYPTTTIDSAPRLGVLTGATTIQASVGSTAIANNITYSAATDYAAAVLARDTDGGAEAEEYQVFVKDSTTYWRLLWLLLGQNDASFYGGFGNLSAVGSLDNFNVRSASASAFNPSVNLAGSQSLGTTWTAPDGDFFMRFTLTTLPASSSRIHIKRKNASNYWRFISLSTGSIEIREVIAGVETFRASGGAAVNGSAITVIFDGVNIRALVGTTQAYSYTTAYNYLRETSAELATLNGAVISDMRVAKHYRRSTNGLGSELVTDGTMTADVTNWPAVLTPTTREYTGGRLHIVTDATSEGASQAVAGLSVGSYYVVSFDYEVTSGTLRAEIASNGGLTLTGSGSDSFAFVATATSHSLQFLTSGAAGEFYIDNASLKLQNFARDSQGEILDGVSNG